jgi:hypothetical protein
MSWSVIFKPSFLKVCFLIFFKNESPDSQHYFMDEAKNWIADSYVTFCGFFFVDSWRSPIGKQIYK